MQLFSRKNTVFFEQINNLFFPFIKIRLYHLKNNVHNLCQSRRSSVKPGADAELPPEAELTAERKKKNADCVAFLGANIRSGTGTVRPGKFFLPDQSTVWCGY